MGATSLLAEPVRWAVLGVCALALAVHLGHTRAGHGEHRWWHGGHAFMAAAMAWMLLPTGLAAGSAPLWFIGGLGGAGAAVLHALLRRWDGARIDPAWLTLAAGLAATAYMELVPAGVTAPAVTYAWAAVLVCETLGWFTGVLSGREGIPSAVGATRADRLVLGLLGLGMAYLFVAMQQVPMPPM